MMKTDFGQIKIIESIPPKFDDDDFVAYDLEMFGLNEKQLHRPTSGQFACLTCCADGKTVYITRKEEEVQAFIDASQTATMIFHNASFDLMHLRRWAEIPERNKFWDSLLIDRILWAGYFTDFSLKDCARRYLQVYMEKETREDFAKAEEMTPEMYQYSVKDPVATWLITQKQRKLMRPQDMKIWQEEDLPALWATLDFMGFRMDVAEWKKVALENKAEVERLKATFPFNPNSNPQKLKYLKEVEHLKNLRNVQKGTLEKYDNPMAKKLVEYNTISKRASTYGLNWLDGYLEDDDRMYSSFDVNLAVTGRFASSDRNLQNIPVRDTPIFRRAFIAGVGNVLVVGDWGQQEPRIGAHISQDELLIEIFREGRDVYYEIGAIIEGHKIEPTPENKHIRKVVYKPVVLGMFYGMSARGLMRKTGLPEEQCEEILNTVFTNFKGVAQYVRRQQKAGDFVTTLTGKRMYLNKYDFMWRANAVNYPIQGTAASMLKRAIALIHERWPVKKCKFGIVAPVHDELVVEAPQEYAQDIAQLVEGVMIEVGEKLCPSIPWVADISIGKNWGCKE